MKIVVALNNNYIKEELEKIYKDDVYKYDFCEKEAVIEYLSNNKQEDITLITKDTLEGNLDRRLYIKHIKLASSNVKIVYIVEKLTQDYKRFLFANEVLNILEGETINIKDLIDSIETNNMVIYKSHTENFDGGKVKKFEIAESNSDNMYIVKRKEMIAVYGTSGSGKSIVASAIAKELSKALDVLVALLDMNIQNPSIDIINNLEINSNILGNIVEDVDKYNSMIQDIKEYLLKDVDNKRLSYMTNNVSLFESKNKLCNKYYETIYNAVKKDYDISVIDLPSTPFLDVVNYTLTNATKILFVVNPNYISIRQAKKYLEIITKLWNVNKDKIGIIVNKVTSNSLDNIQVKSLLKYYKVIANFNYNKSVEGLINGEYDNLKFNGNYNTLYKWLDIDKNIESTKRFKHSYNLFGNRLTAQKV